MRATSRWQTRALIGLLVAAIPATLWAEPQARAKPESATIARCGAGWLERRQGHLVLHLKGSPYEIGYQHGALLADQVKSNFDNLLKNKASQPIATLGPFKVMPRTLIRSIIAEQREFVSRSYFEEMAGLAAGAGMGLGEVQEGNFIPEMFHCSGFAVMNSATKDGTLLHGRVLDYAIDWGLQEHAVLIVAEPDGQIPFVNVSYAGFIGCVTGMNAKNISIGEMGGGGLGHWRGVPMALLVREALGKGKTLDEAIAVFRDNPRTCEYYYVLADGKTNRAVGMEASWDTFTLIKPGQRHPLLPKPVKDCVLLSAGSRYGELVKRTQAGHGALTPQQALQLMARPVAMRSNLHNVLFEPHSTRFWVAHATADGRPAAEQAYRQFQLTELLKAQPDADSREIPLPARTAQRKP